MNLSLDCVLHIKTGYGRLRTNQTETQGKRPTNGRAL